MHKDEQYEWPHVVRDELVQLIHIYENRFVTTLALYFDLKNYNIFNKIVTGQIHFPHYNLITYITYNCHRNIVVKQYIILMRKELYWRIFILQYNSFLLTFVCPIN